MNVSTYLQITTFIAAILTLAAIGVTPSTAIPISQPVLIVIFLGVTQFLWFTLIIESYEEGDTGFPI